MLVVGRSEVLLLMLIRNVAALPHDAAEGGGEAWNSLRMIEASTSGQFSILSFQFPVYNPW